MKNHILYSFKRCPYAIRVRWALLTCGIEVELREVDLRNKPSDILNKSNSQTVPLLILENGGIIEESKDIILWALSNSEKKLKNYFQNDQKKEILNIIKRNDNEFKFHLDRFKYASRFDKEKTKYHFVESLKIVKEWNNILLGNSTNWLIGDNESIADWCIWPFIRQFKIACDNQKISNYLEPNINSWLKYFENHSKYKKVMVKYKVWDKKDEKIIFPSN